ncbi:DNA-processing protein DprA [Brachybacterium sp. DNPG3]
MSPIDDPEGRARITWSLIAEPSDAMALLLRQAFGPAEALRLAEVSDGADLLHALHGALPTDPSRPAGTPLTTAQDAIGRWRRRLARIDVDDTLAEAARRGIRPVVPGDDEWPACIDDLRESAPHCLWVLGAARLDEVARTRRVALVGSRASTGYGDDIASSFGAAFAADGGTVVSGGAYGIDASAHRGALAVGGPTIAVLAGGLDSLYPRGNERMLRSIAERHLLVAEAPPGTAPTRWRFLSRNRLIAALSEAVVVVEASWRSGALSTARHADQLSRPVGAVPGPIGAAASAGAHRLIRERGAVLITAPEEVVDLLPRGAAAGQSGFAVQDELDLLSPSDRRVLDAVPPRSAIARERLADEIGFTALQVDAALGRLDLLGLVTVSGEQVRRPRDR